MYRKKATKSLGLWAIGFAWRGLTAGILLTATLALPADRLWVGRFSQDGLEAWQEKVFDGHTAYRLVTEDGREVVRADSNGSASGLYREIKVDLDRTPYLEWSWKVAADLGSPAERTRGGDDYPARVYVIFSGGIAFWRTKTISYVWSSAQPRGTTWSSAYTDQARMVAVRGEGAATGRWHRERRDVAADYRALFGGEAGEVDAVAVMTDTDNTGKRVTAFYGDIHFSPGTEP
ncbi:DUF3047 domain-containing protein [Thiohalorhabdus sp.]|uniref:DUF3047 domain-containing protein n=1 Tax=Thiohalorhabdus sp. TaxID=3094134 RepID=UPI002FC2BD99